jgi:Predicted endonuclease containing a URI domain
MPYVYILECSDGSYYVGSTIDLERRLAQHQAGEGALYTRSRRPVTSVFYEEFDRIDDAYARQKQVQNWSRSKRKGLIEGNFGAVSDAGRKRRALVSLRDASDPKHEDQ